MAYQGNHGYNNKPYQNRNAVPAAPIRALELPENYLEQAENLMQNEFSAITSTKLRRLYSMTTDIYNDERLSTEENLSPESVIAIGMMRIRMAYECGRDEKVAGFVRKARIMEYLKGLGSKRQNFIHFAHYMEALVAYHKFFGGRD